MAAIVKDAGDDPDVTHGALIRVRVGPAASGAGVVFVAGEGVGTVTRPGLPIPPGEPAINPTPRAMIIDALARRGMSDATVEISIPGGEALAARTLNGRLGIVGGLSILGTTGIVVPFSCAAWIDTIHRGIDVARATGLEQIAASTGSTSEAAIQRLHDLPDHALIEMGDFAGATLKYLARRPVARVSLAGGLAKMTKLAQGRLDLHSKRGSLDLEALARMAGLPAIAGAGSGAAAFALAEAAGIDLAAHVADAAWRTAAPLLAGSGIALEIVLFDREGCLHARTGFMAT
jgi:cobalt-precorrin-5B (C1)-methyltransferase